MTFECLRDKERKILKIKTLFVYIYMWEIAGEKVLLYEKVRKYCSLFDIIIYRHFNRWITWSTCVSQGIKILRPFNVYRCIIYFSHSQNMITLFIFGYIWSRWMTHLHKSTNSDVLRPWFTREDSVIQGFDRLYEGTKSYFFSLLHKKVFSDEIISYTYRHPLEGSRRVI